MIYEPHDYQKYVIEYIQRHPVSAVFLDMGLGKTSITLTAINNLLFDYFAVHKVLVIAPLRVARNTWCDEIKKWDHLSNIKYSIVVGTEKERISAPSASKSSRTRYKRREKRLTAELNGCHQAYRASAAFLFAYICGKHACRAPNTPNCTFFRTKAKT